MIMLGYLLILNYSGSNELQAWADDFFSRAQIIRESKLQQWNGDEFVSMVEEYPLGFFEKWKDKKGFLIKPIWVSFGDSDRQILFSAKMPLVNDGEYSLFLWGENQELTLLLHYQGAKTTPALFSKSNLEAAKGKDLSTKEINNFKFGSWALGYDTTGKGVVVSFQDAFFHLQPEQRRVSYYKLEGTNICNGAHFGMKPVVWSDKILSQIGENGSLIPIVSLVKPQKVEGLFHKKRKKLKSFSGLMGRPLPGKFHARSRGNVLHFKEYLISRNSKKLKYGLHEATYYSHAQLNHRVSAIAEKELVTFDMNNSETISRVELSERAYEVSLGVDGRYVVVKSGPKPRSNETQYYMLNAESGNIVEVLSKKVSWIGFLYENKVFCKVSGEKNLVVLDSKTNLASTTIPARFFQLDYRNQSNIKQANRATFKKGKGISVFLDGQRLFNTEVVPYKGTGLIAH